MVRHHYNLATSNDIQVLNMAGNYYDLVTKIGDIATILTVILMRQRLLVRSKIPAETMGTVKDISLLSLAIKSIKCKRIISKSKQAGKIIIQKAVKEYCLKEKYNRILQSKEP